MGNCVTPLTDNCRYMKALYKYETKWINRNFFGAPGDETQMGDWTCLWKRVAAQGRCRMEEGRHPNCDEHNIWIVKGRVKYGPIMDWARHWYCSWATVTHIHWLRHRCIHLQINAAYIGIGIQLHSIIRPSWITHLALSGSNLFWRIGIGSCSAQITAFL